MALSEVSGTEMETPLRRKTGASHQGRLRAAVALRISEGYRHFWVAMSQVLPELMQLSYSIWPSIQALLPAHTL